MKGLLSLMVGMIAWSTAFAGGYYVSPSGNDANNGRFSTPWKTITKANASLVAGDTVYLMAGTYTQQIRPQNSGVAGRPIVFSNYESDVCSLYVNSAVVYLEDKSYVVIRGLALQMTYWSNSPVVVVSGGSHNLITDCRIYGASTHNTTNWGDWPTVRFSSTNYNRFLRNFVDRQDHDIIDDMYRGDGLCVFGDSRHNIFEGNTIANVSHFGIAIPYGVDGDSYNIVRNNRVYDCHVGIGNTDATYRCLYEGNLSWSPGQVDTYRGGVSCEFSPHTSIIRYNAFFDDSSSTGSVQRNPGSNNSFVTNTAISTPVDNRVYHNVFMGESGTSGARFSLFIQNDEPNNFDFGRNVFANNIIAYPARNAESYVISWQDYGKTYSTVSDTFRCNLLWNSAPGSAVASWAVGPSFGAFHLTLDQLKSRMPTVWDESNFEASPLWLDSTSAQENRRFDLSTGSPCVDRAVPLTVTVAPVSGSTAIRVADASYFHPNWGDNPYDRGDSISVDGVRAELQSIDYDNNILYTTEPVTVAANRGVYVAATYSTLAGYQIRMVGAAPDVGAVEFGSGSSQPDPPTPRAPGTPAIANVSGSGTTLPLTGEIQWSYVPGAEWYQIQISLVSSFASTAVDETDLTSRSYALAGLGNNTQYYARVRAFNQVGAGSWSRTAQFTTGSSSEGPAKGTDGILANGNFEDGLTGWGFYTNGGGTLSSSTEAQEGLVAAKVSITAAGSNVQLYQVGIGLASSSKYRLTFYARSNTGHDFSMSMMQNGEPYANYGLASRVVDLETSWREYTVDFETSGFADSVSDGYLRIWFASHAAAGDEYYFDNVRLARTDGTGTEGSSVAIGGELPEETHLKQNYPNPFNPETRIRFELAAQENVRLTVYDVRGAKVSVLADGPHTAGIHEAVFDAENLASGTYICVMKTDTRVETRKMLLVR